MYSIVIPVYNEAESLRLLVKEILETLKNKLIFEIIIINDGSTDDSLEVLFQMDKQIPNLFVLNLIYNYGKSHAIYLGVQMSNYNNIITLDGDLQVCAIDILSLIKYKNNHNAVIGYRQNRNDTFIKNNISKVSNILRRYILNDTIIDAGCPLKLFNKNDFLKIPLFEGVHRFYATFFQRMGIEVVQRDIHWRKRPYGCTKYNNIERLVCSVMNLIYILFYFRKY